MERPFYTPKGYTRLQDLSGYFLMQSKGIACPFNCITPCYYQKKPVSAHEGFPLSITNHMLSHRNTYLLGVR